MAYEALKQVYAKFSSSAEMWKISVAQLDFLLRGRRLHTALSLVEDLIVGKGEQFIVVHCQSNYCINLSSALLSLPCRM